MKIDSETLPRRWLFTGAAWLLLLACVRLLLAVQLQLFGDEAFYRWESQNLAWAYSDLPPATALLIRAGTGLWGDSVIAVRGLFLLSGLALPAAVYFLARPLAGRAGGLMAAGLSLLLPATATVGVMAVPDSLLLTQCTLLLGCLERACRANAPGWWLAVGLLAALGFLIHYRFVFMAAPLGLAFLLYPALRSRLASPWPWLAAVLAALGLLPALIFNLGNDFEAMGFHFGRRHPWRFHPEGLGYALEQTAAVSPVLYGFILLALAYSLREAWRGDYRHQLLSSVSLFYIPGLILLAPWVDQTSTTVHWAWVGYLPMLVVLPLVLQRLWRRGRGSRWLIAGGLGLAAVMVAGSLAMMLAPLQFDALPPALQDKVSVKMVGWDGLRRRVAGHYRPGETLYVGEYYVAAQLRQAPFLDSRMVVLEQDKIHRDGRARQLHLWGVAEQFAPRDGSGGLALLDYETANRNEIYRQVDTLCRRFRRIDTLEEFSRFGGRRRYGLYRVHGARAPVDYARRPVSPLCLPPLRGRVDSMDEYRRPRQGVVGFRGYLLAQPEGIVSMRAVIDGQDFPGRYGVSRGDVRRVLGPTISDPNYPLVGFEGEIDTTRLPNGRHRMVFIGVTRWGREGVFKELELEVAN